MASEAADSLRSKAYANILDLICEGEVEGVVGGWQGIYLDGTPLQNQDGTNNFSGVTVEARNGSNSQTFIPGFTAVESETAVAVEIKKATPVTRTITNTDVNAARVTISIPNLSSTNSSNGDVNGTTVQYKIQVDSGSGFVDQAISQENISLGSGTTIGSSRTLYNATINVNWTGQTPDWSGPWDQTYSYRIEGQLNGGSWTTLVTNTISGRGTSTEYSSINEWGEWSSYTEYFAPTGSASHALDVTDGVWNFRIVKTGGYNSASINGSAVAYTPTITITGKTTTKYQRSHRVNLSGSGPWDIRVVRITDDSASSFLQNKTYFESYAEIIDAKLRYPNSALVGIKVDSSQFQRIPSRSYDMKLLKIQVPANYDQVNKSYDGTWDGTFKTAWSDNPAWCFYDLVTKSRYGLGNYIAASQVDKWSLYAIGQYCDQRVPNGKGGFEPRFSCNLYIQSRQEAFNVINDLASCFRAMAYWSTGSLVLSQDAPSDPVALYSQANVVEGLFNYSGASAKARHTVALVEWNDPTDFYRKAVEYVEDAEGIARYGVIEKSITSIGCTSQGQAHRIGKWLLFTEKYESETVQFKVGLEGALARPGQVIKVADSARAGARYGGRVLSATTTQITVDSQPDTSASGTWTLYCMMPNGTVESKTVSGNSSGVITVASAFSTTPQANSAWILSHSSVEAQTFRVITVIEMENNQYAVTALKHYPDKYASVERNLNLGTRDITNLSVQPVAPAAVNVTEQLYTYQAEVRAKINLDWENVNYASSYRVAWRKDNNNFTFDTTSTSNIEILNVTPGSYTFRVWSVGPLGKLSQTYTETTATIYGKTLPPADVTGLSSVIDANIGATLTWTANEDVDIEKYEIRQGSSWASATLLGTIKGTAFTVPSLPSGTTYFVVKAIDTSGNYSDNAAQTTVTITGASAPTITAAYAGPDLVLSWNAVSGTLATQSYEIRYGSSWASGTVIGAIKTTTFGIKAQWVGTRSFFIAAKDLNGNYGTAGQYDAVVLAPAAVTMTQEVIDNNVLLRWGDAKTTLPLDHYEVRRGSTWAGATVIGSVSAQFTVYFESAAGTFTYWVAGVDAAGNVGTPSSVSALVNQPPDYVLQYNYNTTFGGTLSNMVLENGTIIGPFDTTETWQTHFSSRTWSSPQDQITAGYPYYLQPTASSGYYEETIDYGTVLAATKITVTPTYQVVTGSPTITPKISVKKLSGDAWTDYDGLSSVYVTDFRYVKIRYTIATSGGDDMVRFSGINVRFDVKLKNDAGVVAASASDSGGTTVTFNTTFVDVQSITVTPKGTSARYALYDFTDAPNPTSFKVLVFDNSGSRVSCDVSWSVKGV